MIFFVRIFIIGILTYLLSSFTVWWAGGIISFVVCAMLPSAYLVSFISALIGVGVVWFSVAWKIDIENSSNFSSMVAELFQIDDPFLLVLISGLVGGIFGGILGITGNAFRGLWSKKRKNTIS